MNEFAFRKPNLLDSLAQRVKYAHRTASAEETSQKMKAEQIRRNGFVMLENFVSGERLEQLQKRVHEELHAGRFNYPVLAQSKIDPIKNKTLIDNYMLGSGKDYLKQGVAFDHSEFKSYEQVLADFKPSTLEFKLPKHDKTFFDLWLDPYLLGIVEEYLGYAPFLLEAYVRRNFPSPYRTMNHFWHRDLNDKFLLLKGFIFLSDCDLTQGPHEYVQETHTDYTLNGKRYYDDEEVFGKYPMNSGRIIQSQVKAGTVILEDTRGLHRAALPQQGYRDLGYSVFLPLPWYKNYKYVNYQISEKTFQELSPRQRKYIPHNFVVRS